MKAVAAVITSVAVDVVDPELTAVNVVVPQPLFDVASVSASMNVGKTNEMVSPTLKTTFSENANETDEGAAVTGLSIVNTLVSRVGVGCVIAGDDTIVVAVMSLAPAKVNATVLVAKLEG
jgi:hypothetical protein